MFQPSEFADCHSFSCCVMKSTVMFLKVVQEIISSPCGSMICCFSLTNQKRGPNSILRNFRATGLPMWVCLFEGTPFWSFLKEAKRQLLPQGVPPTKKTSHPCLPSVPRIHPRLRPDPSACTPAAAWSVAAFFASAVASSLAASKASGRLTYRSDRSDLSLFSNSLSSQTFLSLSLYLSIKRSSTHVVTSAELSQGRVNFVGIVDRQVDR